jgi:flagellar hook-length control protein FliK
MEMPGHAAQGLKGVQTVGTIKGGRNAAQAVISDFKKKLDSLSAAGQPVAAVQMSGTLPENTAMATDTAAQEPLQMGVGILEGFGLPDSQTDIGAASADAAPKTAVSEQAGEAAGQAQTSGQFARMLEQEQPGMAAADMPQQPNADTGEYSGSLESTNRTAADAEAAMSGDETAMRQLQSKLAPGTARPEAQTETQITAAQPEAQHKTQAAVAQPEAQHRTQAAVIQPEAQPEVQMAAAQADTVQPAAQVTADGAAAEKPAVTEPQTVTADMPQQVEDDTQKQPAAKAAPAAAAIANADGTVAPQADTAVQADTAPGTASAQTAESAFVQDNVIRIVDKAGAHVREGRYEFDVDLKPDFLGKVSIRLTMQDGEIRMHVRAEDPAVRGMFSDQTNALVSAMKEKGIVLSGVDVSPQDPMTAGREAFAQSGNGGGSQRREGQNGWITDRYGGEAFETLTPVSELLGGSSVEYLA